jgi:hypothetical protein
MGEAKRRKKLDPNFGKIPGPRKATQLDRENLSPVLAQLAILDTINSTSVGVGSHLSCST